MDETNIDNYGHVTNLFPCRLTITNHIISNATTFTAYIDEKFATREFAGIIQATSGTQRIPDVESASFDGSRIYEIRLWQVVDSNSADSTLAYEFRWVNDVGAVELTLMKGITNTVSGGSESKPVSGRSHKVSYLQHGSAADSDAGSTSEAPSTQTGRNKEDTTIKQVTVVEFIHEGDKYRNTVIMDQLSMGGWKYNV